MINKMYNTLSMTEWVGSTANDSNDMVGLRMVDEMIILRMVLGYTPCAMKKQRNKLSIFIYLFKKNKKKK
jgi:hypothetical protein